MKAISKNPFAIVLVALFASFLLALSVPFAWGEEANEGVTEEMCDFIGPRLLGAENQSEGNADETLEPTEGWNLSGTCEWRLDQNTYCLTLRSANNAPNGIGILDSRPWSDYKEAIREIKIEGYISGLRTFSNYSGVASIGGLDKLVFEGTFGDGMFFGCSSLKSLDLSGLDTSNVTNMSYMFADCSSLESLDLSGFDTSNVGNMAQMFSGCSSLKSLDLSGLDTSNVTNMSSMFRDCSSLASLDLSGMDTSNVGNMARMFNGCSSLESLDLSSFNTSNVANMSWMFSSCSSLSSLDISKFNTRLVADMSCMFSKCALKSIDISNFRTTNVDSMDYMFHGCSSLASLDLSGMDTSKVTDMGSMFLGCSSLASLDLSGMDTSKVTNMGYTFADCSSLESLDLSGFDTSKVTNMSSMFVGCSSLASLDLSAFDASNVTYRDMFDSALKEITVGEKSASLVPSGKWYNSKGEAFYSVPEGVADTYTAAIFITNIKIESPASTLLDVGGSIQLKATVEPANTTESIVWGTYNDDVVTVDQNGYVTALETGYATVYASDGVQYSSIRDAIQINVNKRVQGISISETAKVIKLSDGPFSLDATVTPADAFNGAIAWSSSNTTVATVDATGRVVPKQVGTATITASAGTMAAHCLLTVLESDEDVIPVESVALNATTKSLSGKSSAQLVATVMPPDATYGAIRWTSSNERVVTVNAEGLISSTGKGAATVVATSLDGKKSATCEVTVTNPPTGLAFAASPVQLKIGESARISFSATGELPGTTEEISGIQWSISDPALASLQGDGKQATISGKSVGDVRIDVRARYGNSELATATDMSIVWADAEQVVLNETKKTVLVGHEPIELQANVKPDSAAGTTVQWSSSNPSIASVDQEGVIAIHHAGNAVIYARAGSVSASCSIEVQTKSVPSSDDSDVDGFISLENSELAEELDGLSFRIKDSERESDGSLQNSVLSNVGEGSSVLDIYEMDFIDGNGDVKPWHSADYQLTVHVAKSDELKSLADAFYPTVHYVGENAQAIEAKKTWTEGDDVVFQTNHFSTYAISASPVPQDVVGNTFAGAKPEANQTRVGSLVNSGDSFGAVGIAFGVVALLAAALGLTLFLRRRSE